MILQEEAVLFRKFFNLNKEWDMFESLQRSFSKKNCPNSTALTFRVLTTIMEEQREIAAKIFPSGKFS
jgi:hypothetical protein